MRNYDKWNELQGLRGKITIKHLLFGEQEYKCDELKVVNDNDKIGVVVGRAVLFVYKQRVVDFCTDGNICTVGDDMLTISVIVNKM